MPVPYISFINLNLLITYGCFSSTFFKLLLRTWLFHPVWQVIILSVRLKCYVLL